MADLDLAIRQAEDDLRRERAQDNIARHADTNADEAARERQQELSDRARRDAEILSRSPRLQDYLANPVNAAVAHDDVGILAAQEQSTSQWAAVMSGNPGALRNFVMSTAAAIATSGAPVRRQFELGQIENRQSRLVTLQRDAVQGRRILTSADRRHIRRNIDVLDDELEDTGNDYGPFILGPTARMIPLQIESFANAFNHAGAERDEAWETLYGNDRAQQEARARIESGDIGQIVRSAILAPTAWTAATGAMIGGAAEGYFGTTFNAEASNFYHTMRREGIDPTIAARYAEEYATVATGIEYASTGLALATGGLGKVAGAVFQRAIYGAGGRALTRATYAQVAREAAREIIAQAAISGAEESAQSGAQSLFAQIARNDQAGGSTQMSAAAQQIANDSQLLEDMLTDAMVSFWVGSQAGVGFAVPGTALNANIGIADVRRAQMTQEIIQSFADGAANSRLRARDRNEYARAINTITEGTPIEAAYIDAERFVGAFNQDLDAALRAADQIEGVGASALEAALTNGGQVRVPMGGLAAIADTKQFGELARHVRIGPDRMTAAEVEARMTLGVDLERAASEAVRIQGERAVAKAQEDSVYQRVLEQMDSAEAFVPEANRAVARMIARGIVAQAQRGGVAPETLLDRIGLSVEGPFGGRATDPRVEAILDRADNAAPEIPRNAIPRDRVRVATPRQIPRRVVEAQEAGEIDGLAYAKGDMLVSEDADGAQPWPVGREIFNSTYTAIGNGLYAKKATPAGYFVTDRDVTIETREGPREAKAGDVVMIGAAGEMWPMPRADFDQRYDGGDQAFEKSGIHPTALRFGSEAEVMALQALVERKASGEEIMSSALLTAVADHVDSTPYTVDLKTAMGPDFYAGREFVDPETGERIVGEAVVERLRAIYSAKAGGPVAKEKRAVIVIGYPGAGKSTFINNLAREMRAAVGDADVAKEFVPAYEQGYNTQAVHFESARLRQDAVLPFLEDGSNIIVERVGDKADSVLANLEQLKEAGYEVSLLHIKVEPNEAVRRAATRFIGGGRYIDPQYYRAIFGKVDGAFATAVADSRWEGYVEVDANGPQGTAYASDAQGLSSGWLRTAALGRSATDAANDARVVGDRGGGSGGDGFRQDGIAPAFYSAVARFIENSKTARAPSAQWWATISKAPGVKKEELEWLGLQDWLSAQAGPIAREDVLAFVRENGVRVEETVLGGYSVSPEVQRELLSLVEERDRVQDAMWGSDTAAIAAATQDVRVQAAYRAFLEAEREGADALMLELDRDAQRLADQRRSARRRRQLEVRSEARDLSSRLAERISELEGERRKTDTRWSQYTLPGGENYRELILYVPGIEPYAKTDTVHYGDVGEGRAIAWIRFKERVDVNGRRTLHVDEFQSKRHQDARERGYKSDDEFTVSNDGGSIWRVRDANGQRVDTIDGSTGFSSEQLARDAIATGQMRSNSRRVPDAPFKNNAWASLAMKRMIRWAAENGFEQIAWTQGKVQAERFSLDKHITDLRYQPAVQAPGMDSPGILIALDGEKIVLNQNATPEQLTEIVGREVAEKLLSAGMNRQGFHQLQGQDLRVGGEGMRAFYDKILVNIANDLGKKFGARVEETRIDTGFDEGRLREAERSGDQDAIDSAIMFGARHEIVHSLPITPEMREAAMEGQALFQRNQTAQGQTIFQRNEQGFIKSALVRFTERRDLSTPIHEFGGHVFLETLRIIAAEPTATAQARADWQTVLDWFGVTNEQWATMSQLPLKQQYDALRPYHEKFARGFEVYVMEGKSPSIALRQVFGMFKRWMMSVYKEIKDIPDAPGLTPEIRAVYDRLLATDEEIAQAQIAMGAEEKMTREQFGAIGNAFADKAYERYLANIDRARAEAAEEVERRAVGVLVAEQKRWWRSEERKVRETVKLDLQAQADWTAYDWLTGKRVPEGAEPIRLSPAVAREEYPASLVDMVPPELLVSDVEGFTAQARAVKQMLRAARPKRFAEAISDLGGIKLLDSEARGDVQAILGTDRAVPVRGRMKRQLINNASGRPLDGSDGLIQALWEMGYFGAKPAGMGFAQSPDAGAGRGGQRPTYTAEQILGRQPTPEEAALHEGGFDLLNEYYHGAGTGELIQLRVRGNPHRGDFATPDEFFAEVSRQSRRVVGGERPLREGYERAVMALTRQGRIGVWDGNEAAIWNVRDIAMQPGAGVTLEGGALRPSEHGRLGPGIYITPYERTATSSMPRPNAPARGDGGEGFNQDDYGERPSIDDFLAKLRADLAGDEQYSIDDESTVQAIRDAERTRDWFAERGVDIDAKPAEVKRQIEAMAPALDFQGLDADTIASMVNGVVGARAFESGQELLEALARLPKFHDAVKQETERRLREKFGDPLEDGSMAEQARRAAHGAAAEAKIEIELDAIERATGGQQRPVSAAAKAVAERQIERMTVKQIRNYDWFLANERRHAKAAQEALAKGDALGARQAKHRQLVNFHLYRLARAAADEMDMALRYFKRLQRLGARAAIDPDYVDQIDGLLEQYELRQISGPETQRRIALAAWVRSMEDRGLGHMVTIDPRIIDQAKRQPFDQLDLDEARALVDAVKNIEHLGRLKDRLLDAADQRAFADVVSDLTARMEATGPISKKVTANYSPTAFERTADEMRKAHAEMTRMEFLFRYLDGGANGPLWRALWSPFARAANKESTMMNQSAQRMRAIWGRYTGGERARMFKTRYTVSGLAVGAATSYTRAELISVALNLGNEGNVRALVDGFGWTSAPGSEIDYAAAKVNIVAELDKVLTQRDWETVQQIWELVGSYRDDAFALQEDLTGLRPEAVQSEPVLTSYGEFAGGYYPLKFDRTRDLRVDKVESKQEVQELYGSNWTAPMTRKGHLINRVGSGGRPVKLSLAVATEHMQNAIHDIAYRRAVVDVNRIISDSRFAESFIAVAGRPMYDQLAPWLQAIASDRVDPSAFMWKFLQKLRGNAAIAAMGYRLSTALQQLTGIVQAIPMLGAAEMAGGLVKLVGRPDRIATKARFILNRSEFMRSRVQTFDRDVRETIERMETTDPLHPIKENAFALVGMFDWAVSSVVWTTAYDKARAGKVDGIDAIDEEAAVGYADSAVRSTQSAGLPQDLPAVMRGNQVNKLLTMFFSYFSVLYNWTAFDQVMNTRKGRLPLHVFVGNMALIYVISPLIAEALAGRWEPREDEDEEARNARLGAVVGRFPFQMVPVLRDMANAAGSYYEYQLSPAQSGPTQIIKALEDAAQGRTFDSEATTKRAVVAAGFAFGWPTPAAWIPADYVADKLEGEEEEGFDPIEAFVRDSR